MSDIDGTDFEDRPQGRIDRSYSDANDQMEHAVGWPVPLQSLPELPETAENELFRGERVISPFEGEFARSFRERQLLDERKAEVYSIWCSLVSDWNNDPSERGFEHQTFLRRKIMEKELEFRAEEKAWIKRKKNLLRRALAELES
ncbi:hypothetical protein EN833_13530 [Mesorhizobium sp. M4B.F.Ca.ET.190.01.1.1]|uniref:hypothetical protein n=1 Tax=unclassified Mesorhizobium TaxID=325217 RepID=UPI001091BD4F|nr:MULTISPECIES: hypothetical protein [unclassified Mesorhizobium]TGR10544.1 hypothetical protein EN843_13525 [Mesorhizobium sp. M4B.F.Ca.ET.200.01.1.1]TGS19634.1 hypothetical protein EN833_13530 [Mesorhizobium sp. M4B.F.Ca.ET.190.01.1.1]TGT32400.1 hypothetical protein EN815_07905 [Mesorhizobium sp. M4B.F.Ca.ET.172.01.1.1]